MAISADITSVVTEDSDPAAAPFRISRVPGKSLLTFDFTITADGPIRAWRARLAPTNHNAGRLLGKRGMVCGSGDRCSTQSFSLDAASGVSFEETVTADKMGDPPDGDYEVKVFAMQPGEWNE